MALYEFVCECNHKYSDLSKFDPTGEYPQISCPKCGSAKKEKQFSTPNLLGTQSRRDIFSNKAGRNMERAQDERRYAEAMSHMGTDPYSTGEFGKVPDDLGSLDEGIHDHEL